MMKQKAQVVVGLVVTAAIWTAVTAVAEPGPSRTLPRPSTNHRMRVVHPRADVDPGMPGVDPDVHTLSRIIRPNGRSGTTGTTVAPK